MTVVPVAGDVSKSIEPPCRLCRVAVVVALVAVLVGSAGSTAYDPALTALLRAAGAKWAGATVSAQGGAGLELSSGTAVMAIGPGGGGPGGGNGVSAQIRTWVQQHYTATTVGGQTVYDLTAPTGG